MKKDGRYSHLVSRLIEAAAAEVRRNYEAIGTAGSPSAGDNDASERNIVHALAYAAAKFGYRALFEVRSNGQRIDTVLVGPPRMNGPDLICVEAKNIHENNLASCTEDIEKLAENGVARQLDLKSRKPYRLFLASLWVSPEMNVRTWLLNYSANKRVRRPMDTDLAAFQKALERYKAHRLASHVDSLWEQRDREDRIQKGLKNKIYTHYLIAAHW